jgi:hypothetical protein
MAYIGNQPFTTAFLTDQFSGNGSTVAFTLSAAPANTASIIVAVSGVLQDPTTYSVSGTTLTFSAAPPSGTGNISVRFLGIPASGVVTTAYRTQTEFTATAGQTTFSVPSYTVGFIDVYRNGALLGSADFTATNGTTVVLAAGASAGDLVETVSFSVSSVLNAIPATNGAVTNAYLLDGSITKAKMAASGAWAPTGTVIQVVNAAITTYVSSSSSTFADTGVTATITPNFATSKILVLIDHAGCSKETNNTALQIKVLRGSTQIIYIEDIGGANNTTTPNYFGTVSTNYLDSPATTSATTYKSQFASRANNALVSVGNYGSVAVTSTITLMEIAA